jgi:outer membrane lipoprotein SlyB
MDSRLIRGLVACVLLFGSGLSTNLSASSTQAVTINYGIVTSIGTVQKDSKHAGGALAGGMIGALIGPRRHRGLRMVAGAAAGAAIQGATTSGMLQQYTVDLAGGGSAVVTTEQADIRLDDCVSVEQGQYANIRRVSAIHCDGSGFGSAPEHHVSISNYCDSAKAELTNAETDDQIEFAMKKVRTLCED